VPGLIKFSKKFESALSSALPKAGLQLLQPHEELVVFFENYESAVVVVRKKEVSKRLSRRGRVARASEAPSRSGSKLAEAFRFFEVPQANGQVNALSNEWAVDLGAAPGGWTKVLLEQGYRVVAIDNGPLDAGLKPYFSSGKLVHLEQDAFHFVPDFPVKIVTCDVVDQPNKVTELMKKWALKNYSKELIFNLKLPMKKRYQSVKLCLGEISHSLVSKGFEVTLDAHQLFHDRQEVTVNVTIDKRLAKELGAEANI
jgi:23S rRNA (cytidine2498-2'-O)-methyltransferase